VSNLPLAPATASVLALLLPAITFAGNFPYCNRHNFRLATDYVANIQRSIAPRGMLLTTDWQVYSPLLYLRETEQQRRDVVAIDLQMLRRSWYYGYLKTQYPDLITENQQAVEAFLVELRHWEKDPEAFARSPALSKGINDRFHEMILAFVSNHLRQAPVYITGEVGTGTTGEDALLTQLFAQRFELVPRGLVFQLTTDHNFQADAGSDLVTRGLADGTFRFAVDDVVVLKILPAYVTMLVNRGRYLETYGRYDEAMQFYKRALALQPNSTLAQQAVNNLRRAKQKLSLPAGS
jgi:tetratricopeptide (TPR) repeat protein